MRNNSQKVYIDVPLVLEGTPLHFSDKFVQYQPPADSLELGLDLLTRLDNAIRSNDDNELLSLYLNYYEPTNASHFADKDWPACHEIEAQFEDKDFNAKVQALYNELRLRNQFDRLKNDDTGRFLDVAEQAWETYESIFERESKEIAFPPIVAWEIMQNFLVELGKYHQMRHGMTDQSKVDDSVFNIKQSKKMLNLLISHIGSASDEKRVPASRENFGHFAIVVLAALQVYEGNYKQALAIISRISISNLAVYSRSIGSLLTLFLTAGFAYFMLEQYKESARLTEMLLLFFQKNKKYFAGAIGERMVTGQFQKLAGLLCLNYIFLEEKPKNLIMEIFKTTTIKIKDKQVREKLSEKYAKLRQNDVGTFSKLFQVCSLASVNNNSQQVHDIALSRFKQLQTITLNTILQHYTQISLAKIASMMKVTEPEVMVRIESFNNISTGSAAWDRTIMEPLLSQTRKLHVQVIDGVVKLDTDETNVNEGFSEWQQYKEEISWLVQKVNSL